MASWKSQPDNERVFKHTSKDGNKNQPITKSELSDFMSENKSGVLITGGKSNRKQRRTHDKKLKRI